MTAERHPNVADIVEVDGQFYILATSALADAEDLVLKSGDTFAILDRFGNMRPIGLREQGFYHDGTRYLSTFLLRLGDDLPLLLSSTVTDDNAFASVDLTNVDVFRDGRLELQRGSLHFSRVTFLSEGTCTSRLVVRNYQQRTVRVRLALTFDADYADIFEVRGTRRLRRGTRIATHLERGALVLGYRGRDDVVRQTRICIDPPPTRWTDGGADIDLELTAGAETTRDVTILCDRAGATRPAVAFAVGRERAITALERERAPYAQVTTSNETFNKWIARSVADLTMLTTQTPAGPYPYAGVPWFSTPFGRDGVITALQCLWTNPELARGVLAYLASTQATSTRAEEDAEPGKILHEARGGEMAALGEVPFGRYYGGHDTTPLFVMLAAAYYESTADRAFIDELSPHIDAALGWIEHSGDRDGDGLLEYFRQSPDGLVNQGWKDSHDAVFHRDGTLATGPLALCDIQAYAYGAWMGAAALARATGRTAEAGRLEARAEVLRAHFEAAFWLDDLGTYALALDGDKHPCRVRSSNAGHALFTGLATPDHAEAVARTLRSDDMFSGWGVRTIAASELRFNPMSYHNGSLWPHDNAIIAAGLSRAGCHEDATHIFTGLFDASTFVTLHRLPELFCGFPREPGRGPTLYPVACAPQAWAAGSVFMLLQAALGLEISATAGRLVFRRPRLPSFLRHVRIEGLRVGRAAVDVRIERHEKSVSVEVVRRDGDVEIVTIK